MNLVLGPKETKVLDPDPVISPRPIVWSIGLVLLGILLFGVFGLGWFVGKANAAELDPRKRPHDLYLLEKPTDDRRDNDRNMIWRIGAGYSDREACEDAKKSVRVIRPAGTLQCHEAKR